MAENRSKSVQYLLRMPPGMREELKQAADFHARSLNAEIVERLENYMKLFGLKPKVLYLEHTKDELEKELATVRAELAEQKAITKQLQHLIQEGHEKAQFDSDNENDALSAIEDRYNDMKAQAAYLESLKAELLELSKERDEIKSDADELVKQQSEAIARLEKTQRTTTNVLVGLQKVLQRAADGDDGELKRIISTFQVLDEEEG